MRIPDNTPLSAGSTVWGYLRDSGGHGQDRSIDQQRDILRAYCTKHQLILLEIFIDEARTGDNADLRDDLLRMMTLARETYPQIHDRKKREEIAAKLRHGIVFWSFARLGRDSTESAMIRTDLRVRGLIVTSLSDDILTGNSSLDPILEALIDFKNEMDLKVISNEVKRGLHAMVGMRDTHPAFLAQNPGWQPTGSYLGIAPIRVPPRGYTCEQIAVGMRRDGRLRVVQRLVPDPVFWDRTLLAWRLRVMEQASYQEIIEVTHLFRAANSFLTFFKNEIYTGVFRFGDQVYGTPDDPFVLPLIPRDWFEIEAARRDKQAARRKKGGTASPDVADPRSYTHGRILSGLVVCARCGSKLHAETIGARQTAKRKHYEWPFYWCSAAKKKKCDAGKINAVRLEETVLRRLKDDVFSPAKLRGHAARIAGNLQQRRQQLVEELDALEASLSDARRRATNLADALAQRPASMTLLQQLDKAEADQQTLSREIQTRQADLAYWSAYEIDQTDLERISQRLINTLQSDDPHKVRLALADFIKQIKVDSGENASATIYYRFPKAGSNLGPVPVPVEPTHLTVHPWGKRRQKRTGD